MTDGELLAAALGEPTPTIAPLRAELASWIAASRPYRAFVEENAAKIRRKIRQAAGADGLGDVWLELDAARRLLVDRRATLIYERYLADKTRGPDFTVTFKSHLVFNVEARRLRAPVAASRLGEAVCEKLRQLPASAINVVLVGADAPATPDPATGSAGSGADPLDPAATVRRLARRAEAGDDDYFRGRGYRDARDFSRTLPRLSALLEQVRWRDAGAPAATLWLNPQAKHPLPDDARKLLLLGWAARGERP